MDWQPIETAPKDGRPVLVYGPVLPHAYSRRDYAGADHPRVASFLRDMLWGVGWFVSDGFHAGMMVKPTHWSPLPGPPVQAAAATGCAQPSEAATAHASP